MTIMCYVGPEHALRLDSRIRLDSCGCGFSERPVLQQLCLGGLHFSSDSVELLSPAPPQAFP
jgi:hypothetical protein